VRVCVSMCVRVCACLCVYVCCTTHGVGRLSRSMPDSVSASACAPRHLKFVFLAEASLRSADSDMVDGGVTGSGQRRYLRSLCFVVGHRG